jgi:hypothetical protein
MAKTHTPKKSAVLLTPDICSNFSGHKDDTVQWQNVPSTGCSISKGTSQWPFSPASPINPATTIATIVVNPPTTTSYNFVVSCCANEATKNVTVTP